MAGKLRIGALASGGGTNLQSIIDGCRNGTIEAEVSVVITNKPGAGALERAHNAGIPTRCIDHRDFPDREEYDREVVKVLNDAGVELVVLAGFMRIITAEFLKAFPYRIMNIHPALLPAFPGLHVQRKAIEYGARFSGCTVHFVDGGVDTGPIIIQAVVPVLETDTEDSLSARILTQEHRIYPKAIQLFAERRIRLEGRRVFIDPPSSVDESTLINPPL